MILTLVKKLMMNILNLKLVILLEYKNIKTFSQKAMFQISLMELLWIKKSKNTVLWTYVINDLKDGKIFGTFYEKELRVEKVIKRFKMCE